MVMNSQNIGHVVVFLLVALFVYIFSIAPSFTKANAVVTEESSRGRELQVNVKVCPSFWFDDDQRDNRELKNLFRTRLYEFISNKYADSTTMPPGSWRAGSIQLVSETPTTENYKPDGRCRDIAVQLASRTTDAEVDNGNHEAVSAVSNLFQDHKLLRVGVRDAHGFIIQFNPKSHQWRGAAIGFAVLIAEKLGRKVEFTRLKSLESRFDAIRYGVADLTISLISYSPQRAKRAYLSNPYYNTGLVLGTFKTIEEETTAVRTRTELNSKKNTVLAVDGSSSLDYIKANLPKINLLTTTTNTEIPALSRELMAAPEAGDIYFITDELIARRWSEAAMIHVDGKRLLTDDDSYVVAIGDEALVAPVNAVIATGSVEKIFSWSHQR